jgi:hypothetical protein
MYIHIYRVGTAPGAIGTDSEVQACLSAPSYTQFFCCIFFEDAGACDPAGSEEAATHGLVHGWIGGWMLCPGIFLLTEYFVQEHLLSSGDFLSWNVLTESIFCAGIFLLNILSRNISCRVDIFVLECPYWVNSLCWNILTDECFVVVVEHPCRLNILSWNILTESIFCAGISLLNILPRNISCRVTFLSWNILTESIFCAGIFLLNILSRNTSCRVTIFVLEYPYWINILSWNILTDWILCSGSGTSLPFEYFVLEQSLLTDYFVLEHLYWPNILHGKVARTSGQTTRLQWTARTKQLLLTTRPFSSTTLK